MKSIAITGRRPEALPWQNNENSMRAMSLKNRLKYRLSSLYEEGYYTYYIGMARGIDTYVAEILLGLRELQEYRNIRIVACIPYKGFADEWSKADRDRYYSILSLVDDVKTLSDAFSKGAIFARNEYMVDSSDALLAVYNNIENGGTYNTLCYAKKRGKRIIIEEI